MYSDFEYIHLAAKQPLPPETHSRAQGRLLCGIWLGAAAIDPVLMPVMPTLWSRIPNVLQVAMPARAGYPPVTAIQTCRSSRPKSMYSDFEGISKTNVRN